MYVNQFDIICRAICIYIIPYYINYIRVVGKIRFTVVSTQNRVYSSIIYQLFYHTKNCKPAFAHPIYYIYYKSVKV